MNFLEGKQEIQIDGVRVYLMKETLGFHSFHWVSETVISNIRMLERAVEIFQKQSFDLIIAHDWLAALTAKSLQTIYRIPVILTIHDTEVGKRNNHLTREQYYIAEMENWISHIASRIITTSRFMEKEITKTYKIPTHAIDIIPCGVNPDEFQTKCNLQDFRRIFVKEHEAKIVLFVGRLTTIKGPDVLLKAAQKVMEYLPNTTFIFVGDGVSLQELVKSAQAINANGNIIFTGHLSGKVLNAMYRIANCLVVPSRYEPFGMVTLEAMICKTPVIVSNTGGLSEIVDHENTGLKVSPEDEIQLAHAIMRILSDTQLANKLANNAWKMCQEKYLWNKVAIKIKEIYSQTILQFTSKQA